MKHLVITAVLLTSANVAVANSQQFCGAIAGLAESVYLARYQGMPEEKLLYDLIEATDQGELDNLKIAATSVKEIYSMPSSKIYRGGEAQLGSAVFEVCMQNSSI